MYPTETAARSGDNRKGCAFQTQFATLCVFEHCSALVVVVSRKFLFCVGSCAAVEFGACNCENLDRVALGKLESKLCKERIFCLVSAACLEAARLLNLLEICLAYVWFHAFL